MSEIYLSLKYIYHYITHFNTYVVFSVAGMYQIFFWSFFHWWRLVSWVNYIALKMF